MNNTNTWEGMLLDIVQSTREGVAKGVDLAMEQAPEIVNQLLTWKMVDNGIRCAGCIAIVATFCILYRIYWKKSEEFDHDDKVFSRGLIGAIGGIVGVVVLLCAFEYGMTALKIYIAPKIYLIEYFSALIR